MLKFNNNHIFTGYLKQLLASTNLPTYRIYTKEHQQYKEKYGEESPEILETITTNSYTYKNHIRYIPYIKDGQIAEYIFTENPEATSIENATGYRKWKVIDTYYPEKRALNNTKTLRITNNIYDTYTHEYLGDYLRFMRDYNHLDLMPLYNCFSNNICQNLYIECAHISEETSVDKHFLFNAKDKRYKIYMIPVKLFKEYTIAIDCDTEVEICCSIYGKYQDNTVDLYNTLAHDTYRRFAKLQFNHPILYSPLKEIQAFVAKDSLVELATRESDLKLFLKLPAHNNSSITILEGNYLGFNDRFTTHKLSSKNGKTINNLQVNQNHTVTNLWDEETDTIISEQKYTATHNFKPITYLQLLGANTGSSYPFADKLIEYLCENVITPLDPVTDNIARVQTVVDGATNHTIIGLPGIWDTRMQPILYNSLYNTKVAQEIQQDNFGYVDKNIEQIFSAPVWNSEWNRYVITSIANADLYPDIYKATKLDS